MKTWDAVIVGAGIIGVSLARFLRKHGLSVLIVERNEPGREASSAAAGMLAACDPMLPPALQAVADASAAMYSEFVHEIEDESGMRVDYRDAGVIAFLSQAPQPPLHPALRAITAAEACALEPALAAAAPSPNPFFVREASVDPRALIAASLKAAKHRGIEIASGAAATEVAVTDGRATGIKTAKTFFPAGIVVNCCGAWAGSLPPIHFPTRPIKGQMLALIPPRPGLLRHVVRAPAVYLVPRSGGRILVGSTLEDVGFDKRVDPATIHGLHQVAARLLPELGEARMLESWAGLRPGTSDNLPILGPTALAAYFVASGHYRDGILLAPVTAQWMSQVVRGLQPELDMRLFSCARFR